MAMIGEQPDNLARAVTRGYGLTVSVKKLDTLAQDLEQALRRLLTEPKFSANAARISHTMRAHRLTPAEKAAGKAVSHDAMLAKLLSACRNLHTFICNQAVWHARHSKGT